MLLLLGHWEHGTRKRPPIANCRKYGTLLKKFCCQDAISRSYEMWAADRDTFRGAPPSKFPSDHTPAYSTCEGLALSWLFLSYATCWRVDEVPIHKGDPDTLVLGRVFYLSAGNECQICSTQLRLMQLQASVTCAVNPHIALSITYTYHKWPKYSTFRWLLSSFTKWPLYRGFTVFM